MSETETERNEAIEFMKKNIATANDRISTLLNMKANRELYHYDWKWEESWCALELDRRNREVSYFELAITALQNQSNAERKAEKAIAECKNQIQDSEDFFNGAEPENDFPEGRWKACSRILEILEGNDK